jgi:hypothetical protein
MPNVVQLSLHICQSSNCKQLIISETTGEYDVVTNPGGWGAPNTPLLANVVDAILDITAPDGTTYTFEDSDLGPNFPFPDPTGLEEMVFNYNGSIVGNYTNPTNITAFPDGIYYIKYTIKYMKGAVEYSIFTNQNVLLTCQTRCCVDKLFHMASQTKECADCDSNLLNKALEAEAYLKSAEYAAGCGKVEMAKKNLAKAQWICNTKNCSNC